jgi:heme A synthase
VNQVCELFSKWSQALYGAQAVLSTLLATTESILADPEITSCSDWHLKHEYFEKRRCLQTVLPETDRRLKKILTGSYGGVLGRLWGFVCAFHLFVACVYLDGYGPGRGPGRQALKSWKLLAMEEATFLSVV